MIAGTSGLVSNKVLDIDVDDLGDAQSAAEGEKFESKKSSHIECSRIQRVAAKCTEQKKWICSFNAIHSAYAEIV